CPASKARHADFSDAYLYCRPNHRIDVGPDHANSFENCGTLYANPRSLREKCSAKLRNGLNSNSHLGSAQSPGGRTAAANFGKRGRDSGRWNSLPIGPPASQAFFCAQLPGKALYKGRTTTTANDQASFI